MSQAKVDKYKKEKLNRKKNMQKEKVKSVVRKTVAGVIAALIVGWLGYSAYDMYDSSKPQQTAEVDYSSVTDYQQNLLTTDGE